MYPTQRHFIPFENLADILTGFKAFAKKVLNNFYNQAYNSASRADQKAMLFDYPIFEKNVNTLLEGIGKGFEIKTKYGDPSFELLQNLRQSAVFFAANKTFVQSSELADLLIRPDGTIRPLAEFSKMASPLVVQYNRTWLKTEYDLSVRTARAAKDFNQALSTIQEFPNLKYLPSVAATPRDSHKNLYGTIRPVNDPFWSTHLPPSDWNCKCSFEPTNDSETSIPTDLPNPVEAMAHNPARTGKIFTEAHPYFQKVGNLDISQNAIILSSFRKIVAKNAQKLKQVPISNGVFTLQITGAGLRDILNKYHKHPFKKLLLLNDHKALIQAIQSAEYVDEAFDHKKDINIVRWLYYKINIGGEDSFINIKELLDGKYHLYSLTDKLLK